ncbi:acyl-CoA dehydrogenase [Myceligenerans pegani]|uniref:Acyl-CoA dehydrogenase family protein n=1 Tax=Myceligenerans pegani TaxID=2776917 RepID=A0ABR9MSR3_9MICO|nr:acyl-CoA dehydrogenase [Myceligenerans sp. TRM 65318]MBE1874407.1 acyl-CoA dehydrogenase family protein [Myceligenerans sp. TRM 65318]MBE3016678.1 acyl-CoA dehydrogenase family protein [Myceligenerans sp. TRM 65318]
MTTTSEPPTTTLAVPTAAPRTATQDRRNEPARGASTASDGPRVNVAELEHLLLGRWKEVRSNARRLVAEREEIWKIDGISKEEHRERTLETMKFMARDEHGQVWRAFPERLGGNDDAGGNLVGCEELFVADPSLQIKSGVQWGLFAAAILHLGTEEQQDRLLPGAMDLSVPGAFAMTETGHGSDVASVGTTATYDPGTEEFVINTPFRGAWKQYLGNAARHGVAATVFAQLITNGVNHGVHCFYVPIRDPETLEFLPGVGGEDDGHKGGLNGIDNGKLHFTDVRIPRRDLLARYGEVAADGTYTSSIDSPGRRFFTMLGALVQGRVTLDGSASVAAKVGLAIATKYADERRQFAAGDGQEEITLLDYAMHRKRLLPRIAETYAISFAHEELLELFDGVFSGATDTPENREDLETTAAALKATSTWFAMDTLQTCRQACGGAGYLSENRFTSMRADLDVYTTFEGDNHILLQLAAKRLVGDHGKRLARAAKSPAGMAGIVAGRLKDTLLHKAPLRKLGQNVADGGGARAASNLLDARTQRALLQERVDGLVNSVAMGLRPALGTKDPAKAQEIFDDNQVELITSSIAWAELFRWDAFTKALDEIEDVGTRAIMTTVRDVYGLTVIERNLDWYLVGGRLSVSRAKAVTTTIHHLLKQIRPHAVDLVDAFGYGPRHLRAPIADGSERLRQDEARQYYRDLAASGKAPRSEKSLRKTGAKA